MLLRAGVINYYKPYHVRQFSLYGFPNAVLRFLSKNFIDPLHTHLKFSVLKVVTYNSKDSRELKEFMGDMMPVPKFNVTNQLL